MVRFAACSGRSSGMLWLAICLMALGPASGLQGQDASQWVQGIVRDKDGQPAADVEVRIQPQSITAKTAADGTFTLQYPRQSLFGQTITAQNAAGDLQAYRFFQWQRTGNEKPPESVELTLEPPAKVKIQVHDGADKPLAGVRVVAIADHSHKISGETDANGLVEVLIPATARLRTVFAKAPKLGFDYVTLINEQEFYNNVAAVPATRPPTEPVVLVLDGGRTLEIKLVDGDGKPMSDTGIYPWLFNKGGNAIEHFNTAFVVDEFSTKTNASGIATFDWLPQWEISDKFVFWPITNNSNQQRSTVDMSSTASSVTIEIARGVMIGGIARKPGGAPAAGVMISLRSMMSDGNQYGNGMQTGADGRYQLETQPDSICMLLVDDKEWAAPMLTGIRIEPKKNIENLDFDLRPATTLSGHVTVAGKPVAGQDVSLQQSGMDTNSNPQMRPKAGERTYVAPINHYRQAMTDAEGRYEFKIGPGRYLLKAGQNSAPQQFEIKDETTREFNFAVARPDRGPLAIHVVGGEPASDVAGAIVEIRSQNHWWSAETLVTDAQGRANVERNLAQTFLHVRTADGAQAAMIVIGPDDAAAEVAVQPCGSAKGRLVDGSTSKPLANTGFQFGIRPELGITIYGGVDFGGAAATTDDEGRFTLPNLIVKQDYSFDVPQRDGEPNMQSRAPMSITSVGESDVGDVVMQSMARPGMPTPAAAVVAGIDAPATKASWSRMLVLGNLIGIPLLVIGLLVLRRMTR